ncbi:cell division protein FtsQ/DivIB [Leucobacter chromiireducens]|uniref:FtsQ-type POTRA domain-containing protein n=1 Tax=Leucobacter chromiireducens subsp. chromiireducens TaxID=660067 RepID=A0ABS1SRR9_9MICO|nr:cell division protein FtsQ/DivIB [Leucobacter chromiireducens]MBL3690773.1 FtsQ-type POTRA domain-containing protein [Leucobacter chromiireducens subsp. chromiireducens]
MKRPSGFDRAPERPDSNEPAAAEDFAETAAWDPEAPTPPPAAPRRSVLDRLRSGVAGVSSSEAPAARDTDAHDTVARGTDVYNFDALNEVADNEVAENLVAENEAAEHGLPGSDAASLPGVESSGLVDAADAHTVDLSSIRPGADVAEPGEQSRSGGALARWRADRAEDPVRAAERRVRAAERQRKSQRRREQQRFTVAARRRRRMWLIVLGAVAGLVLFVAAGVFTPLMAVRNIELVGASGVPEDEVRAALAQFEGVPLALVDDGEVHRALEPFPLIQRYAVERIPPHTLTVRIEERVAVVSLAEEDGVGLYDAAGVKLGSAEAAPKGVPLGSGALKDRSSQAFRSATRALRDMPSELRDQVSGVTASSGQDVTLTLASGIEVMWGDGESSRRKSAVLATMLKSLGDREVSYIDVSSSEAPVFR